MNGEHHCRVWLLHVDRPRAEHNRLSLWIPDRWATAEAIPRPRPGEGCGLGGIGASAVVYPWAPVLTSIQMVVPVNGASGSRFTGILTAPAPHGHAAAARRCGSGGYRWRPGDPGTVIGGGGHGCRSPTGLRGRATGPGPLWGCLLAVHQPKNNFSKKHDTYHQTSSLAQLVERSAVNR